MAKNLLFIGTYTQPLPHVMTAHAEGIYVYSFDPASGKISYRSTLRGIENPTYLTADSTGEHLYAVAELEDARPNTCNAYAIAPETGALSFINSQPTLGKAACYVTLDKSGKYAFVANYTSGQTWAMFPVRPDGSLGPLCASTEHVGSSVNKARQDRSHGHCVAVDANNNYLFVSDLGIDQLVCYRLDTASSKLIPVPDNNLHLKPGSGPRHVVFHPNGRFIYVISELTASVSVFSYDPVSAKGQPLQTLSALPDGYTGQKWAAAIRITPDGRFVYASNRGHDSLAMYAVDQQTGTLTALGFQSTGGQIPRDFNIDPSGQWLLAANQATDTVVTFKINPATGILEETGLVAGVATPVSLAFA